MKPRLVLYLFVWLVFASHTSGQTVGLVLSGGGAKGISHIGVIKVLEENGIPIDYITGTSIGAIVGAMYAIGYTPAQMETLVTSEEFLRWSKGEIKAEDVYFFKKPMPDPAWLELDFVRDSVWTPKLPTYVVPNHLMDFAFMRILAPAGAACNHNFDSLLVPFRCVAADIYGSQEIVFKEGNLAKAVRASMTYPFYFKPIKVNDKLMMDGGLYNNFPSDVMASAFAPEVMIGSKVTSNSEPPEEDELLLQLENIFMRKSSFSLPADTSFLIEPETKDIELMNFEHTGEIINRGAEAASQKIDAITQVVTRRISGEELAARRKAFISKKPELSFKTIFVEGLTEKQNEYVRKSLSASGHELSDEKLKEKYLQLASDEVISSIYPFSTFNKQDTTFDLHLQIDSREAVTTRVGGNISSGSINQAFMGLQYKYLGMRAISIDANTHFGRLYSSAQIKARVDQPGKFPYSVDAGFTFNRWDYYKSNPDVFFENLKPSYIIKNESNFQVNFSFPLKNNAKGVIGGAIANNTDRYYQQAGFNPLDTADKTNYNLHTYHLSYEENTLNYRQFPYSGHLLRFRPRYVIGKERYTPGSASSNHRFFKEKKNYLMYEFVFDNYLRLTPWLTSGIYFEGVYSSQGFFRNHIATLINTPSFNPIPHSKTLFLRNYRAPVYGGGGLKSIVHITNRFSWRTEGYVFLPYRKLLKTGNLNTSYADPLRYRHFMGSSSLVYHTPVGPASLSVNYYEKEGKNAYLFFSFGYILFNRQAIF